MHGLEVLYGSLDRFFYEMALSTLSIGPRAAECFCDTVIADGVLRHLPEIELASVNELLETHLGSGIDDFDADNMRALFATREDRLVEHFTSYLFALKGRLQERIVAAAVA